MTAALRRDDIEAGAAYSYQVGSYQVNSYQEGAIARSADRMPDVSLPQVPLAHQQRVSARSQLAVVAPETSPPSVQPTVKPKVRPFPKQTATPSWLHVLIIAQRGTFALTSVLIAVVLSLYGWTVISQQRWTSAYGRLQDLQRYERELMSAIGTLKHDLLEEASQPGSGLNQMTPTDILEVPAAPHRPLMPSEPAPAPQPWDRQRVVGY
ncbi:MAG: hypothetical protein ACFB8W_06335 [Elainellaceae cyanobacterium]